MESGKAEEEEEEEGRDGRVIETLAGRDFVVAVLREEGAVEEATVEER
jgi:hypothetical protein